MVTVSSRAVMVSSLAVTIAKAAVDTAGVAVDTVMAAVDTEEEEVMEVRFAWFVYQVNRIDIVLCVQNKRYSYVSIMLCP